MSNQRDGTEQAIGSEARLESRLADFERVMDACAEGDLTRRLDTDIEDESLASVAESFNAMMAEFEATTGQLKGLADTVVIASENVSEGAREVKAASEGAGERTEDIAVSTAEQRQRLETVSAEMESLSASIEEVSASAMTVAETAAETLQRGEDGQAAAQHAIDEVDGILTMTDRTVTNVKRLDEQIAEIEAIVDLISGIADQTNLLALNANIEAARAGEAGRGFTVVANNVKELAEETKEAVEQITDVVDDVQSQTDKTVDDIEAMQDDVESGVDTIESALDAFDDIGDRIEDTNNGIQEINTAAEQQAESAQRIFASVESVAELSKDVNEQGDEVADSIREQTAAVSHVVGSVGPLSDRVATLGATLDDLETSDAVTASADEISDVDGVSLVESDLTPSAAGRESADAVTSMATLANLDNSYWVSWAKGYREAADVFGYGTDIQANGGDVTTQRRQFETAIENGVDVVVGQTYTNDSVRDLSKLCLDAGVPTVLAVTIADWYTPQDAGEEFVQFFTPHLVNHAYTAATVLFESMGGSGEFVHIEGNRGTSTNIGRNNGLDLALSEYPDIELLGPRLEGSFIKSEAREAMVELVQQHGDDIQGFFAQNDAMALGGLSVLQEHGIDVPVVGIDATEQGLVKVLNGEMVGTVSGMGPWQAAWSLAKAHDYRNGYKQAPAERMLSFNAPLCVKNPAEWRNIVDRIPVVDAARYKQDVFEGEAPYDWEKMSVVESGDDWDPQVDLQPIRRDDLEPLLGWTQDTKPAGYSLPAVFDDERAMDEVERLYAKQFRTDPLQF